MWSSAWRFASALGGLVPRPLVPVAAKKSAVSLPMVASHWPETGSLSSTFSSSSSSVLRGGRFTQSPAVSQLLSVTCRLSPHSDSLSPLSSQYLFNSPFSSFEHIGVHFSVCLIFQCGVLGLLCAAVLPSGLVLCLWACEFYWCLCLGIICGIGPAQGEAPSSRWLLVCFCQAAGPSLGPLETHSWLEVPLADQSWGPTCKNARRTPKTTHVGCV